MSSTISYDESSLTPFQKERISKLKEFRLKGILTSKDFDRKLSEVLKTTSGPTTSTSATTPATTTTTTTAPTRSTPTSAPTRRPITPRSSTTTTTPAVQTPVPVPVTTTTTTTTTATTTTSTAKTTSAPVAPVINKAPPVNATNVSSPPHPPPPPPSSSVTTPPPAPKAQHQVLDTQKVSVKKEEVNPRGNLLESIRAGAALKKVNSNPPAPTVVEKKPAIAMPKATATTTKTATTNVAPVSSTATTTSSKVATVEKTVSSSQSPTSPTSPTSPKSPNAAVSLVVQQKLSKATDYFQQASAAMSSRNMNKAIQLFTDCIGVLEKDGKSSRELLLQMKSLLARGVCYHSSKQFHLAVNDFSKNIEAYRSNSSVFESDSAIAANDASLLMLRSHMSRGNSYDSLSQFSDAVNDFTVFIDLFIPSEDESDEQLVNSASLYSAYHNRGYAFSALGDDSKAIDDFSSAIQQFERVKNKSDTVKNNSVIIDTYFQRGKAYEMVDRVSDAMKDYMTVAQYSPNHHKCHFRIGQIAYYNNDYAQAKKSFDKVIDSSPSDWQSIFNRAQCNKFLSNFDEAIEDFKRTISAKPSFSKAYIELARLLQRTNTGSSEQLVQLYNDGIKRALSGEEEKPSNSVLFSMYFERSLVLSEVDPEKAIEDLDQCIMIDPSSIDAYCNRGLVYYQKLKKYKEAIGNFNVVLEHNPKDEATLLDRGFALARSSEFEKALVDFTQVLKLDPENSAALKGKTFCEQQLQQ